MEAFLSSPTPDSFEPFRSYLPDSRPAGRPADRPSAAIHHGYQEGGLFGLTSEDALRAFLHPTPGISNTQASKKSHERRVL